MQEFKRTQMLLGCENMNKLETARVAVFGIGGVGSYAIEALVRAGIGHIDIFDHDRVDITNLNRQLIALQSTVGKKKADVMKARILDINPHCQVNAYAVYYNEDCKKQYSFKNYDYIIDAIDTVASKLLLIEEANQTETPIISCMGTGNKLHPECLEITDISKTSVCPLARVMRRECKKRGIKTLKVLFSTEEPIQVELLLNEANKPTPGSISFVPSVAGLLLAKEVVLGIIARRD